MHEAAQLILGKHDFTTFRAAECQAKSPVKTLDRLDVSRQADMVVVTASARSFLHHQVRSMVGSLKLVGEGRWTPRDFRAALDAARPLALRHRWRRPTGSTSRGSTTERRRSRPALPAAGTATPTSSSPMLHADELRDEEHRDLQRRQRHDQPRDVDLDDDARGCRRR